MSGKRKDPKDNKAELLEESIITSREAFSRELVEGKEDFLLGEKESISEDLAQLKSFVEKVYEDALRLRSGTRKGEELEMLTLAIETNLQRIEDRLQNYQAWITEGNPLRRQDYLDVDMIEVSSEKIAAILAIETGDGKLPDMSKVKAKRQKATEERRKQSMKSGAASGLTEDRDTQGMILDLRRSEFKRHIVKEKEIETQRSWQTLKHVTKVFLLVIAVALVPISYLAFGRADLTGPETLDPKVYREAMELTQIYAKDREITAVVPPHWKKLLKKEKTIQMQDMVKKVSPRHNRIKVVDGEGYMWAEYRMGEILIY